MSRIDILMATYNGENYVDKQIFSIMSQTFKDWRLIIHDDGSTDNTVRIVRQFCDLDNRILFLEDGCLFRSPGKHFLYLLQFSKAPYICFCDQDDIWLENKLEVMYQYIQKLDISKPQVVFSDAYLFYTKGIKRIIGGHLLVCRPHSLKESLFINGGIHGSASMFNYKMREYLSLDYGCDIMHDHILTLIGCSFGSISFIEEKLFLYRQHDTNVTGNLEVNIFKRLLNAFFHKGKYTLSFHTLKAVNAFYRVNEQFLENKDCRLINYFNKLEKLDPFRRIFVILYCGFSLNNSYAQLFIKVLTRKFLKER